MKKLIYLSICVATLGFQSCSDDDDNLKLRDISVDFAAAELGMEGNSTEITLSLSRATETALNVTVQMTSSEVSDEDIVTTPAMTDGQLIVTVPAGKTTASFIVAKAEGKNPEGSAKFKITALSLTNGYKIGTTQEMTLSFSAILSTGGKLTLEGKDATENYANMVYVDLSNNSQVQIKRKSWNIGFYGGEQFTVILNSSFATVAAATEKTDFAAVTLADAQNAPNLGAGAMDEEFSSSWIDDVTGDLSKTAFGTISENDATNKVYFVASNDNKADRSQWYKVKITRKDNGYLVQYGKVEDTTPKTIEIVKDPLYNVIGLSLETGKTTDAQPEGKKWDIMWAYGAAATSMGSGLTITSFSQDVITSNTLSGVETATVMVDGTTTTYDNFKQADIAAKATFATTANVIGTTWRTPAMPNTNGGVKTDRFYIIKDTYGNIYKLRFLKFGSGDDGERGRPELEYELLK